MLKRMTDTLEWTVRADDDGYLRFSFMDEFGDNPTFTTGDITLMARSHEIYDMMIRLANKIREYDCENELADEAFSLIEDLNVESEYLPEGKIDED